MTAPDPSAAASRPKPLAGLRVLDLTRLLPGPLATQHLADYGAEVIKVEDTGAGDYAREMGAMNGDTSFFYQLVNRNKKSIRLDLKKVEGRMLLLRLVETSDLLVEGFRPGVMAKLGLDYATVAQVNPRIVYCSITGFGQTGPYAMRAGHDINYIGYAGVLDQIGQTGGAPVLPNLQIGDLLGGTMSALFGMLVAIIDARASGAGRQVDVSMTDAAFAHGIFPLVEALAHGQARPRGEDLLTGGVPCYGVYQTADGGFMAVGALEQKFWFLLCETLGREDLKSAHLATGEEGARAREVVAGIFRSRTRAEWCAIFDSIDCCVTPVLRPEESLTDPQLQARGMVIEVDGVKQSGPIVGMSAFSSGPHTRAPACGADSREVLIALGLTVEEIDCLKDKGVI